MWFHFSPKSEKDSSIFTHLLVGAVVRLLDLLPMQSVPITTDVVSSNLDQGEVYNIIW